MEHPRAIILHLSLRKIRHLLNPFVFLTLIYPRPPRLPQLGGPESRSCGQKGGEMGQLWSGIKPPTHFPLEMGNEKSIKPPSIDIS